MNFFTALVALALSATHVAAHGGVTSYVIGGTEYQGFQPYNSPSGQNSLQRQWSTYDPILQASSSYMACNTPGTGPAQQAPKIAAGDKIVAKWKQWTHAEGPVMVYMCKVGASFASSDGSSNCWFKIDEAGLMSGTLAKGNWGLGQVLKTNQWTSTIPANLAPGNYLIRHELLALHQANTPQFYPECAQIVVTGSGTAQPSGEYLVKFPGAYKQNDPGVMVDIYSSQAPSITTYTIPGPKKWTG